MGVLDGMILHGAMTMQPQFGAKLTLDMAALIAVMRQDGYIVLLPESNPVARVTQVQALLVQVQAAVPPIKLF